MNKHGFLINLNWLEAGQLANYAKCSQEVEFALTITNPMSSSVEGLDLETTRLQAQCSNEGLMLKMSALKLFTVANLRYQLS